MLYKIANNRVTTVVFFDADGGKVVLQPKGQKGAIVERSISESTSAQLRAHDSGIKLSLVGEEPPQISGTRRTESIEPVYASTPSDEEVIEGVGEVKTPQERAAALLVTFDRGTVLTYKEFVAQAKAILEPLDKWPSGTPKRSVIIGLLKGVE